MWQVLLMARVSSLSLKIVCDLKMRKEDGDRGEDRDGDGDGGVTKTGGGE